MTTKGISARWRRIFFSAAFSVCIVTGGAALAGEELLVSAAASLKPVLDEIGRLPGQTRVSWNFGGSGALQRQIESGAPVDVFISASPKQMDALEARGLLAPGTRRTLLRNELALIVPRDRPEVRDFAGLALPAVKRLALGEPKSVPAGAYAQEVLAHLKLLASVQPKMVFLLDVRQVLAAVERGDADAGMVYTSDAQGSRAVRVVATAPDGSHSPIIYPAAVLKNAPHPAAARAFVAQLFSAEAAGIFRRGGFGVAPLPEPAGEQAP